MVCCRKAEDDYIGFHPVVTDARKCTDLICLVIFISFWVGSIFVALVAFNAGDPAKLLFAMDYAGNTCGGKSALCNGPCSLRKAVIYPRTNEDLIAAAQAGDKLNVHFFGVCVSTCPKKHDWVCTYEMDAQFEREGFSADLRTEELDRCWTKASLLGAAPVFASLQLTSDPDCRERLSQCWKIYQDHSETFYRCLPASNETLATASSCIDPPFDNTGLSIQNPSFNTIPLSSADPKCISKRTTTRRSKESPAQSNLLFDQLNSLPSTLSRYLLELELAAGVILGVGFTGAMLGGFAYLHLLRQCGGVIVWSTIFIVILLLVTATLFCYVKAGIIDSSIVMSVATVASAALSAAASTESNSTSVGNSIGGAIGPSPAAGVSASPSPAESQRMAQAVVVPSILTADPANQLFFALAAYVLSAASAVLLMLVLFLQRRIAIAVGIVKEASKCISAMPYIVYCPFFSVVPILPARPNSQLPGVVFLYSVVVAVYLHSAGTVSVLGATNLSMGVNATAGDAAFSAVALKDWMQVYNLFGLLWTNQFIQGVGITVIAGAVCEWYWTAEKITLSDSVVLASARRTALYHLGSVALGSFIIALVQLARFVLAYLDRKSKQLQDKNCLLKLVFKCVACCLWCFEKCIKFISKNAYIMVAMDGRSFCSATVHAGKVILNNLGQIGAVSFISFFVLWIGKLLIAAAAGVLAYFILSWAPSEGLTSSFLPVLATTALAFLVGTSFLNVYGMAIDTILLCFCLDREHNNGSKQKPYFMGDSLRKFVRSAKRQVDAESMALNNPEEGKEGATSPQMKKKKRERKKPKKTNNWVNEDEDTRPTNAYSTSPVEVIL